MRNVALDLGNRITFAEALNGAIIKRATVESIEELRPLLGPGTPEARVAIEACREAWHIHDVLSEWGHEVLLIDTTRAREMGIGRHRRKNDRIDAATMALSVEKEDVPRAHVLSPSRRRMRELLTVRKQLTKTRATYAMEARGLLRARGIRIPSCKVDHFAAVTRETCPAEHVALVEPLLKVMAPLSVQLLELDIQLELLARREPVIALLKTTPGVSNVVATAFVSVIDDAKRFKTAHQVQAYLGLVPSENTSGKRRLGAITKEGNSYLRALLVEAAWSVIRSRSPNPLKVWALAVARRRNQKLIAAVALARRLSGVLWAMWRDGTVFEARRVGQKSALGLELQAEGTLGVAHAIRQVSQEKGVVEAARTYAAGKTPRRVKKALKAMSYQT